MKQEIERKFLVADNRWRLTAGPGVLCRQGYLYTGRDGAAVRVRVMGDHGYLTVKGKTQGIVRQEFEYEIPVYDAECMLKTLCGGRIVFKLRYAVLHEENVWEVDEFLDKNSGLVTAEIELARPDQTFVKPEWAGLEVSSDPRYTNAALSLNPVTGKEAVSG